MMRLQDKVSCILEELRIYLEPIILTICTVPYNMIADQNAMEINERVRNFNEIIRQTQQRSVLPMRVLDVARIIEDSLPEGCILGWYPLRQAKEHRVADWPLPEAYKFP